MGKGSPIITLRIDAELSVAMELAIDKRNATTRDEPWDRSAFIKKAIREKLAHLKRSRSKRLGRKKSEQSKEQGGEQ